MYEECLNFSIIKNNNEAFVQFEVPSNNNSTSKKSVTLKDFVSFTKNIDNTDIEDSGYITDSLKRRIVKGSAAEYLFHYPELAANYSIIIKRSSINRWKCLFQNDIGLYSYRDIKPEEARALGLDSNYCDNFALVSLREPLMMKDILYYCKFNTLEDCMNREKIVFATPKSTSIINKVVLNEETPYIKSFFPNHFTDSSICWGTTGHNSRDVLDSVDLNKRETEKNLNKAVNAYFSSTFNTDLYCPPFNRISKTGADLFVAWLKTHYKRVTAIENHIERELTQSDYVDLSYSSDASFVLAMTLSLACACDLDIRTAVFNNNSGCTVNNLFTLLD